MIADKTNTAQILIDKISANAAKVNYISNELLTNALMHLETKGIPTNKHEDYKYCNVDAIIKREFKNIEQKFNSVLNVTEHKFANAITLVVVNGEYSETLSDKMNDKGISVSKLSALNNNSVIGKLANVEADAFVALNTAFSSDGFYLKIGKGKALAAPVHILYVSSANSQAFVNTRNVIELEENAEATIIEQQLVIGEEKVFTNYLSEKIVRQNAGLTCYTLQNEGNFGYSVNTNQVSLNQHGRYSNTTVTLSGTLVRNNHNVVLNGEHCEAHLNGLFISKDVQLVDNHTLVDHAYPNCESNEIYKGVAAGKSTGVFNGKIFVRKDAQKTNAYQSSKNILLSDDATINTKPQLEIYANDVKCSHGTSTGKIDENALFYLNARGIGKETAKKMLLASFAQEVINKIEFEPLHEHISNLFNNSI